MTGGRRWCPSGACLRALALALALAWPLLSTAQKVSPPPAAVLGEDEELETAAYYFPWCRCSRKTYGSSYVIPSSYTMVNDMWCFRVEVGACSWTHNTRCCNTDLHKIEIRADITCIGSRFAGYMGNSLYQLYNVPTQPSVEKAASGPGTSAIIKITRLNLDIGSADGKWVCLKPLSGPCRTPQQTCDFGGFFGDRPPASGCEVAFFNSDLSCCPTGGWYNDDHEKSSPPPPRSSPPPPPRSSSPPPPARQSPPPRPPPPSEECELCYVLQNLRTFTFGPNACDDFATYANSRLTPPELIRQGDVLDEWVCAEDQPDKIKICAVFRSKGVAGQVAAYTSDNEYALVEDLITYLDLEGYICSKASLIFISESVCVSPPLAWIPKSCTPASSPPPPRRSPPPPPRSSPPPPPRQSPPPPPVRSPPPPPRQSPPPPPVRSPPPPRSSPPPPPVRSPPPPPRSPRPPPPVRSPPPPRNSPPPPPVRSPPPPPRSSPPPPPVRSPPPPPRQSPRPPPPAQECELCYVLKNLDSFEFPVDACDRFAQFANDRMTPANFLQNGLLLEPWSCVEDEANIVKVCAVFATPVAAQIAALLVSNNNYRLVEDLVKYMELDDFICNKAYLVFMSESDCVSPPLVWIPTSCNPGSSPPPPRASPRPPPPVESPPPPPRSRPPPPVKSPSPPPRSQSPPPPATGECELCYVLQNLKSFTFPTNACDQFALYANNLLTPPGYLANRLLLDKWYCIDDTADTIRVCATFANAAAAQAAAAYASANNYQLVSNMVAYMKLTEFICKKGYLIFTSESVCARPLLAWNPPACDVPENPFPFCVCNRKAASMPFAIDFQYTVQGDRYCFNLKQVAPIDPNNSCAKVKELHKIEFWIDYSKRFAIRGVYDENGNSLSNVWSVPADNSLKVAPPSSKGWSLDSLKTTTRQICIQTDGTAMSELCLGGWCWTSAFDVNQKCCPRYFSTYERVPPPGVQGR